MKHEPTQQLSLMEIAAWQLPRLRANPPAPLDIIAGIPSLQRGAVWKPAQVEMLWDSLFRGFPIGTILLSNLIQGQKTRSGLHAHGDTKDTPVTHHMLDGQQRCNAIALGFVDPFLHTGERQQACLWIDLDPAIIRKAKNRTREFLFRITTKVHPWGYMVNDDDSCKRLPVGQIDEANLLHQEAGVNSKSSSLAWPHHCTYPVPVAWVLEGLYDESTSLRDRLLARARNVRKNTTIYKNGSKVAWLDKLLDPDDKILESEYVRNLDAGLERLKRFQMIALVIDPALVRGSGSIANVEHLFQRINAAGTTLGGEELRYSLIKAHWPRIEVAIANLRTVTPDGDNRFLPMPESRMAVLAFRAIQTLEGKRFYKELSIPNIRELATNTGGSKMLRNFLELDSLATDEPTLRSCVACIDAWLCHAKGIPSYLRTRIALISPDTYLALLILAYRHNCPDDGEARRLVPGLATVLHFCRMKDGTAEEEVIKRIMSSSGGISETLAGIFVDMQWKTPSRNSWMLAEILAPDDFAAALDVDMKHRLGDHSQIPAENDTIKELLLKNIIKSRDLLLYAQRKYVRDNFNGFDPSLIESDDLKPWDFDHILPSSTFHGKHNISDKNAVRHFYNTIGNLRILDLRNNRRRQDSPSIDIPPEELKDSLLSDEDLGKFHFPSKDDLNKTEKRAAFATAVYSRISRMYRDWYESCNIATLLTR